MVTPSPADYVVLKPGVLVPVEPWLLLLDLESRGCRFDRNPDGQVVVRPGRILTNEDKARLARWSQAVDELVAYCDEERYREVVS